jgi:hypothetical protein
MLPERPAAVESAVDGPSIVILSPGTNASDERDTVPSNEEAANVTVPSEDPSKRIVNVVLAVGAVTSRNSEVQAIPPSVMLLMSVIETGSKYLATI